LKRIQLRFYYCSINIDDINFGATIESLFKDFSKLMHSEFKMSMIGELKFFLGLKIKQQENSNIIHQQK